MDHGSSGLVLLEVWQVSHRDILHDPMLPWFTWRGSALPGRDERRGNFSHTLHSNGKLRPVKCRCLRVLLLSSLHAKLKDTARRWPKHLDTSAHKMHMFIISSSIPRWRRLPWKHQEHLDPFCLSGTFFLLFSCMVFPRVFSSFNFFSEFLPGLSSCSPRREKEETHQVLEIINSHRPFDSQKHMPHGSGSSGLVLLEVSQVSHRDILHDPMLPWFTWRGSALPGRDERRGNRRAHLRKAAWDPPKKPPRWRHLDQGVLKGAKMRNLSWRSRNYAQRMLWVKAFESCFLL